MKHTYNKHRGKAGIPSVRREIEKNLRKGSLVVFLGAGISLNSGIPLAKDIEAYILERLRVSSGLKRLILGYGLPFEAFMEPFVINTNARDLLRIFDFGIPNSNHMLVAHLAKERGLSTIVTTNFDLLLERALREVRLKFRLTMERSGAVNGERNHARITVMKLHGSVHDERNMGITIRNVARSDRMESRIRILDRAFRSSKHKLVLIMGYSCSDIFDVTPYLRNLGPDSISAVFVDHKSKHLKVIEGTTRFGSLKGFIVAGPTDEFVNIMWRSLLEVPYQWRGQSVAPWHAKVDAWLQHNVQKYSKAIAPYIAGCVLKRIDKYRRANSFFRSALAQSTRQTPSWLRINALRFIGDNYRDKGDKTGAVNAIRYMNAALALSVEAKDTRRQSEALLSKGVVYEDRNNHHLALKCYQKALALSRDRRTRLLCLGNIAIVYKNMGGKANFKLALSYHEKALELASRIGDKQSEGRTLGNIGIVYNLLGLKRKAIGYYRKAYKIAIDLADVRHQGIWLENWGVSYIGKRNDLANEKLSQAIELFKSIGADHYISECRRERRAIPKAGNSHSKKPPIS